MNIKESLSLVDCGEIIFDVNLKKYNTYNVDCVALAIVFPNNIEQLKKVIKFCNENKIKVKLIGNGSNLIFSEKYYDIVFINLKNFNNIDITDNIVTASSGVNLMKLAYRVSRAGLTGMEFATGIPATVGGAVYMNAGAYNSDISNVLISAKILDENLNIIELSNKDFGFSYRHSFLQENRNLICLEATFKLEYGKKEEILELIENRKERRINSQPLEFPSAGSVFRNPSKEIFAGKLIEDLGLKGKILGGAKISEKHANFIINTGNATGRDIKELILKIKSDVLEKYNVDLYVEQEFVE